MKTLTLRKYKQYYVAYRMNEIAEFWSWAEPKDKRFYKNEWIKEAGELVVFYPDEWEWKEEWGRFDCGTDYLLELNIDIDNDKVGAYHFGIVYYPLDYEIRKVA